MIIFVQIDVSILIKEDHEEYLSTGKYSDLDTLAEYNLTKSLENLQIKTLPLCNRGSSSRNINKKIPWKSKQYNRCIFFQWVFYFFMNSLYSYKLRLKQCHNRNPISKHHYHFKKSLNEKGAKTCSFAPMIFPHLQWLNSFRWLCVFINNKCQTAFRVYGIEPDTIQTNLKCSFHWRWCCFLPFFCAFSVPAQCWPPFIIYNALEIESPSEMWQHFKYFHTAIC